ncbi:uncharacterized protein LOC135463836 [Liolophura sinensis]|uniref:uncharacterized protein LOC135463836 n=1 Tax=Liolophura sinensis TaxID=3198878 RepID=UPI003158D4B1
MHRSRAFLGTNDIYFRFQTTVLSSCDAWYVTTVSKEISTMAKSKQNLKEDLTCPICVGTFRKPVMLPCQHRFCRECIGLYADKSKSGHTDEASSSTGNEDIHQVIACPVCRDLTCPICVETFRKPVMLPCQHSFCRECIGLYTDKFKSGQADEASSSTGNEDVHQVIACPVCRDLTCPLCVETFHKPVVLPCQHSFCRECIGLYADMSKSGQTDEASSNTGNGDVHQLIACPVCRAPTSLGREGVAGLPPNFHLADVVEKFSSVVKVEDDIPYCSACEENNQAEAIKFCTTFCMLYCKVCLAFLSSHERWI